MLPPKKTSDTTARSRIKKPLLCLIALSGLQKPRQSVRVARQKRAGDHFSGCLIATTRSLQDAPCDLAASGTDPTSRQIGYQVNVAALYHSLIR